MFGLFPKFQPIVKSFQVVWSQLAFLRAVGFFFALTFLGCRQVAKQPAETPPPLIVEPPTEAAYQSLQTLQQLDIPPRDLIDLTRRYKGIAQIPTIAGNAPTDYGIDAEIQFWIKNQDSGQNKAVNATLLHRSDQLNMWVEEGVTVRNRDILPQAAAIIENDLLPLNRRLFGKELQPGVDGDNRIHILHSSQLGESVIGYFSAADEYVQAVNSFSNEKEMLYINVENAPIGSDAYFEVIAHEFQHLIQWHTDSNEAAWLGEGLSELAAYLNGYNEIEFEDDFAGNTDTQLNNWEYGATASAPHYGASFLFAAYFYDRFGEAALQTLAQHPANGILNFEAILPAVGESDFNALFADWTIANYLQSIDRGTGVYGYANLELPPITPATTIKSFPASGAMTVHQFGVDYIIIKGDSPVKFDFTGSRQTGLMPASPHSGDFYWTSIPADESDMTLTRQFDLADVNAASLNFWSWYEIESGWDYAYVAVSVDGGDNWTPLETIYTTTANPQGLSYGAGLTSKSGTGDEAVWVQQQADLTSYAGKPILIRFEYITDQAVHDAGIAVDDISIPEIGYSEDFEAGDGGWRGVGFVRHSNVLPQKFLTQAILLADDDAKIIPLPLADDQSGSWKLPLSSDFNQAIITISGVTPVTTLPAAYRYHIENR